MEQRTILIVVLMAYITLVSLDSVMCRSHGLKYHNHHRSHIHNSYHNHHHTQNSADNSNQQQNQSKSHPKHIKSSVTSWRPSDEDYEDYEDDGRHAYLMTKDNKKSSAEKVTEDQTLETAFEKHMKLGSPSNTHDVYAYQLPSDLWFVVRYSKNLDGQVEKYMNVVDSFTNYLEKLDKDVRTVSVNVKGIETVFRLYNSDRTPKRKTDN